MGVRTHQLAHWALTLLLFGLVGAARSQADDSNPVAQVDEKAARENLAKKLMILSKSLDMREASYTDSATGGKDFNNNDGNAFTSNTTYHSYVWNYCLNWIGARNCQRWLDPYVSPHGAQADRSPLEGLVYDEWNKRKPAVDQPLAPQPQGAQVQYAIWNIKRDPNGNDLITGDGRLDRSSIIDMRLLPEVRRKVEQLGTDTAQRQINLTYDAKGGTQTGTMPNMEALRLMAGRWTKMMRNRLVANLGELRVNDAPVEFGLGEDYSDCQAYTTAMENEFDNLDEKRSPQQPLDPETKAKQIQERIALCRALRRQPVNAINPEVDPNDAQTVREGNPDLEQVDKWRSRVNIALIDSVGRDPNSIPRPRNAPLAKYEYESNIPDWDEGGTTRKMVRETNAQQLAGYNRNLQNAAVGMKEIAARAGIRDNSAEVLKFQIAPGTRNAVELNGLTPEMRGELAGTNFAQTPSGAIDVNKRPEKHLEQSPAELTIHKLY